VLPNVSFASDSHNWNGYEGQSPAGSLTGAAAHVKAPEVDDAACENDSVGDWVGVGGPGGDPTLIQTGLFNINDEGTLGSGGFFQVVDGPLATGGAVPFSNLRYVPGHTAYMKAGTHQFVYTSASAGEQFFRLNELNADQQRLVSRDGAQVLGDSTALDSLGLFDASWRACGRPE
jgi:Peptidase A4 family